MNKEINFSNVEGWECPAFFDINKVTFVGHMSDALDHVIISFSSWDMMTISRNDYQTDVDSVLTKIKEATGKEFVYVPSYVNGQEIPMYLLPEAITAISTSQPEDNGKRNMFIEMQGHPNLQIFDCSSRDQQRIVNAFKAAHPNRVELDSSQSIGAWKHSDKVFINADKVDYIEEGPKNIIYVGLMGMVTFDVRVPEKPVAHKPGSGLSQAFSHSWDPNFPKRKKDLVHTIAQQVNNPDMVQVPHAGNTSYVKPENITEMKVASVGQEGNVYELSMKFWPFTAATRGGSDGTLYAHFKNEKDAQSAKAFLESFATLSNSIKQQSSPKPPKVG